MKTRHTQYSFAPSTLKSELDFSDKTYSRIPA